MNRIVLLVVLLALAGGCSRRGRVSTPPEAQRAGDRALAPEDGSVSQAVFQEGQASWYGDPYHGRQAASGERFDKNELTAAHRTLPFGTWVRVENRTNGEIVDVRINDRGPFVAGRIIDLSERAAEEIDMIRAGVVPVRLFLIEDLTRPTPSAAVRDVFYVVQLGAFSQAENAQRLRRRFESKYTDVYVEPPGNGSSLYRVRLGRALQTDAESLARRLRQEDGVEAIVIETGPVS